MKLACELVVGTEIKKNAKISFFLDPSAMLLLFCPFIWASVWMPLLCCCACASLMRSELLRNPAVKPRFCLPKDCSVVQRRVLTSEHSWRSIIAIALAEPHFTLVAV